MASKRIRIGGDIVDAVTRDLVSACATLGYYAGLDAYRNHTYKHRTYALHDSYGSAVYLNGKLVPETIRHINRSRQTKKDYRAWRGSKNHETTNPWDFGYFGRDSLRNYFEANKRINKKKGITIVVVAAQWYATILEGRGYTVLDKRTLMSSITYRFDQIVAPVMQKYGLKNFVPELKRSLGIDEFFVQDQLSRL